MWSLNCVTFVFEGDDGQEQEEGRARKGSPAAVRRPRQGPGV